MLKTKPKDMIGKFFPILKCPPVIDFCRKRKTKSAFQSSVRPGRNQWPTKNSPKIAKSALPTHDSTTFCYLFDSCRRSMSGCVLATIRHNLTRGPYAAQYNVAPHTTWRCPRGKFVPRSVTKDVTKCYRKNVARWMVLENWDRWQR